jgi:hypothetical protein
VKGLSQILKKKLLFGMYPGLARFSGTQEQHLDIDEYGTLVE